MEEGTDDDDNGEDDDDFRRVRGKGEAACEAQGEGNVSRLGVDFQLLPLLFAVSAVPAACHRSHAIKTRTARCSVSIRSFSEF